MGVAREVKRWYKRLRSRYGKKNGVISCGLLDNPDKERKMETSKHIKRIKKGQFKNDQRTKWRIDSGAH